MQLTNTQCLLSLHRLTRSIKGRVGKYQYPPQAEGAGQRHVE